MKVRKTESTVKPDKFRIGDRKDNLIEVVFFDDVEEITKQTDNESETLYSYYEYPILISYRENLEVSITNDIDTWFNAAKEQFLSAKAAEIRSIRDKLLADTDKNFLIDRLNIDIPENITATAMLEIIKSFFNTLGESIKGPMAIYRQALRDITKQPGFPLDVEFPTIPNEGSKE